MTPKRHRKPYSSPALAAMLAVAVAVVGCDSDSTPTAPDGDPSPEMSVDTEDVVGQGPEGSVVAEGGATIQRTPHGISGQVSMPTPEPGTYTYPSGPEGGAWTDEEGPPEVFTLWAFTFNDPEQCEVPNECSPGDLGDPAGGGAFAMDGVIADGSDIALSGHVSPDSEPFPTETTGAQLENIAGAQVILAVAPHGALDPDLLPDQLRTPTGPGPDIWWLAVFE
ncbi:MAG: hypothetical protein ACOC5E_03420 [Acidobacteriota bacterium]